VPGLDDDGYAERLQHFLNDIADFEREPLLHLQAAGEHVHHAGDFAEADDVAVGDVRDVGFAKKGQHVVLAEGVHFDVFHEHHLAVIFAEKGGA